MGTRLNRLGEAGCTHNVCLEREYYKIEKIQLNFYFFFRLRKSPFIAWASFRNTTSENLYANVMVETSASVLLYVQWVRKKLVNVKKKEKKSRIKQFNRSYSFSR